MLFHLLMLGSWSRWHSDPTLGVSEERPDQQADHARRKFLFFFFSRGGEVNAHNTLYLEFNLTQTKVSYNMTGLLTCALLAIA